MCNAGDPENKNVCFQDGVKATSLDYNIEESTTPDEHVRAMGGNKSIRIRRAMKVQKRPICTINTPSQRIMISAPASNKSRMHSRFPETIDSSEPQYAT